MPRRPSSGMSDVVVAGTGSNAMVAGKPQGGGKSPKGRAEGGKRGRARIGREGEGGGERGKGAGRKVQGSRQMLTEKEKHNERGVYDSGGTRGGGITLGTRQAWARACTRAPRHLARRASTGV